MEYIRVTPAGVGRNPYACRLFTFPEKKLDKLTIYSYNKANFR